VLLSGRTGSVLWTREVPGVWGLPLHLAGCEDHDGDGVADLWVISGEHASRLSSASGEVQAFVVYDGRARFGDIDGDESLETIERAVVRRGWGPLRYEAVVLRVERAGASLAEVVLGDDLNIHWALVDDMDGDGVREVEAFHDGRFYVVFGRRLVGR
jgi:hypothetical protein